MLTYECADCRVVQPPTDVHPERCASCGGHAYPTDESLKVQTGRAAAQNDRFRASWGTDPTVPGRIAATRGVEALGPGALGQIASTVMRFVAFTEDNDPFGARDFGDFEVEVGGERVKVYWKIDLYDLAYEYGSDAPDDPARTRRLLTLLLPEEW